jgi:hypothetical protein
MSFPDPYGWVPQEYLNQMTAPATSTAQVPPGYDPEQWAAFAAAYPEQAANILFSSQQVDTRTPEQQALTDQAFSRMSDPTWNMNNDDFIKKAALLFGGGILANGLSTAFGSGSTAGTYGGAATTYPYAAGNYAGGAITGSALSGVAVPAAVAGGTGVAANALGGAGAAAGGSFLENWLPTITGGVNTLLGAHTANQAADAESAAMQAAIEEQRRQYDTTRADWAPWMESGRDALTQMGDPGKYFAASPDYNFVRGEGTRGVENSFAARGLGQSGNALKALTEFNQNLASGEFGNWFNRQSVRAGMGSTGTGNVTNAGQNTANNVSNLTADRGASRASGIWNRNSILGQGLTDGVSNWLYRRRAA